MSFPVTDRAGERVLPIRVMTDTRSVELFAGHGRGVYSGGLSYVGACARACVARVRVREAHATERGALARALRVRFVPP